MGVRKPSRKAGIQASCHGILGRSVPGTECPDLKVRRSRIFAEETGDTNLQPRGLHQGQVGVEIEDELGRGEQNSDPPWTVIDPLSITDIRRVDSEAFGETAHYPWLHIFVSRQRGRHKGEPILGGPNPNQARFAFLNDDPWVSRPSAGLQPSVRRAKGGVSRERKLSSGREDAKSVVSIG